VFSTPEAFFFVVDVGFQFLCFNCSSVLFQFFSDTTRSWTNEAYEYFGIAQVPPIVPGDTEYHFRRLESSDTFFPLCRYVISYCCNHNHHLNDKVIDFIAM